MEEDLTAFCHASLGYVCAHVKSRGREGETTYEETACSTDNKGLSPVAFPALC